MGHSYGEHFLLISAKMALAFSSVNFIIVKFKSDRQK
nr:MAG TPA: alpha/beta hydrolase family protein [Caudoviricetes sp.]